MFLISVFGISVLFCYWWSCRGHLFCQLMPAYSPEKTKVIFYINTSFLWSTININQQFENVYNFTLSEEWSIDVNFKSKWALLMIMIALILTTSTILIQKEGKFLYKLVKIFKKIHKFLNIIFFFYLIFNFSANRKTLIRKAKEKKKSLLEPKNDLKLWLAKLQTFTI